MKVLFCGGPADGQWKDVPGLQPRSAHGQTYEVVAPPTPLDMRRGTGTLAKAKYRIWNVTLLGYMLQVATPEADHNESDSVLYAVLQRDVADHLRGRS